MAKIPINIKQGSFGGDDVIVGIDLGTTHSLVAFVEDDGTIKVIKDASGRNTLVPSIIHFLETGNILIGEAAKAKLITNPERTIDADGILAARAKEMGSNISQQIKIKSQYGISEEVMTKMLLDSIQSAESDMHIRALMKTKNEAKSILKAVDKFLVQNKYMRTKEEVARIHQLAESIRQALNKNDKDPIQLTIESLNEYSKPLVERYLEITISNSLRGKSI